MKSLRLFAVLLTLVGGTLLSRADERLTLWSQRQPLTYSLPEVTEMQRDRHGVNPAVISLAESMMVDDITRISSHRPQRVSPSEAVVRVIDLASADSLTLRLLEAAGLDITGLTGRRDGFSLVVNDGRLLTVGADHRGTAYALLELSRLAGVSPWEWWNDSHPFARESLSLAGDFNVTRSPGVEYRGVFLNDEDWSLRPWSNLTHEPGLPQGTIGPKTYLEVFKLLLRLRANTLWPAMHEGTVAFFNVDGLGALADSCGITLGSSHCEPLLRNNVGEWDSARRGRYNFITNRQAVLDYWGERLRQIGSGDNLLTLGMRGIHDGSMEGVKTMAEKQAALQDVIEAQRQLISECTGREVSSVPQVFIPYKEVLDIMDRGLEVPDDVTLIWCDDNYGHLTRLSDSIQQTRSGGAGVYYHLSYWGRPHDYLWLGTTQPGLIYHELSTAWLNNARRVWIVNIHDPKTSSYGLELFLDMAWGPDSVAGIGPETHLGHWLEREYGRMAGERLLPAMKEFYRLTNIRRPEHMGWSQVELSDRRAYPRGRSHVGDTEFSFSEFGGEAQRYLRDYARVASVVREIARDVPPERFESYFAQILYPVLSAEAMARKMLLSQLARSYAMGQGNDFARRDSLMNLAGAAAMNAYRDIVALTKFYNDSLASGKWRHLMRMNPRDLYVFNPPWLPTLPDVSDSELPLDSLGGNGVLLPDGWAACDAADYTQASFTPAPVGLLGHSMRAVPLPRGETLTYNLALDHSGEAKLITALIPTQPAVDGPLRVEISVDGDTPCVVDFREKGRTDRWKENVLRNQVRLITNHHLEPTRAVTPEGIPLHTVTVKALDDRVVLDQLMLDSSPRRSHYIIPTFQ